MARVAFVTCATIGTLGSVLAQNEPPGAVIFAYNRFGDDEAPGASVRIDQFEAHIQELRVGGYRVLPLLDVVERLRAGQTLPDRTVALTIDDTHVSVWTEAWPRLQAAGLPFTLFVATDTVDRGRSTHMTWGQIRELAQAGVTIGNLTASFAHLIDQDRAYVLGQIGRANERLRAETGRVPTLFAYPYGEYGSELRALVVGSGFGAAFGLHAGVAHGQSDPMTLPRFPVNETLGSIERFRLTAQALPLPVAEVTPTDMRLARNPPLFGFTVDPRIGDIDQLACFAVGYGRAELERPGERRVEVRLTEPFAPGRARINCTLPAADGRWRWFGAQFYVPEQ